MPQPSSQVKTQDHIPTKLTPTLDKRLFSYVTAATAAGVSLVAVSSAEAKIVYTAANVVIPENGGTVNLDLNNDGIADFGFYFGGYPGLHKAAKTPEGAHSYILAAFPQGSAANAIWAVSSKGANCAAALPPKVKVGPGAPFKASVGVMWASAGSYTRGGTEFCPWASKHRGAFLGLKFFISGQAHYGWAHVTVGNTGTILNGYAYEDVPNQPIHTGQTSGPLSVTQASLTMAPVPQSATLGMLAQGSRGLSIWRRDEEQDA